MSLRCKCLSKKCLTPTEQAPQKNKKYLLNKLFSYSYTTVQYFFISVHSSLKCKLFGHLKKCLFLVKAAILDGEWDKGQLQPCFLLFGEFAICFEEFFITNYGKKNKNKLHVVCLIYKLQVSQTDSEYTVNPILRGHILGQLDIMEMESISVGPAINNLW